MNAETISKVLDIHQNLKWLEAAKKVAKDKKYHRLYYIEEPYDTLSEIDEWHPVDTDIMYSIRDILNRHSLQIRQEIDDRIKELKKELEEL